MFIAQQFATRLAARKEGAEGRWSLLTDFVAEWHAPLQAGDGYSKEELDTAERRLGFALPIALREWYGLAGKREDIVARQNFLVPPEELEISEENGLLIFHSENQGVGEWGLQITDLGMADPPVWLDDSEMHSEQHELIRENDTLSEFALQMIVLESICFAEFRGNASGNERTADIVVQNFQLLGLSDWHWPGNPTRLYGQGDVLVELDQVDRRVPYLWVAACSKASLRDAVKPFGLGWDVLSTSEN